MTARPSLVCSICGVEVVRKGDKAYHVEAIPKEFEYHAPEPVAEAELPEPEDPGPTPGMRQTEALESIAESLRAIVHHLTAGQTG